MAKLVGDLRVIGADSHMTEGHDLFTERAPKGYEDRMPHVETIDGLDMWVIEGKTFGRAGSGGTVENAPRWADKLRKKSSEYFRSNTGSRPSGSKPAAATCNTSSTRPARTTSCSRRTSRTESLHPDPVGMVSDTIATLRPETQRKIMGENAAKLYRV